MKKLAIFVAFSTMWIRWGWAQAPAFTISTIAGSGNTGYTGDGGPALKATLNDPRGVVTDPNGVVYFCDRLNHAVRKIDTNGVISTVAGTGTAGYNGDNIPGTQAQLDQPWRVTMDPAGKSVYRRFGQSPDSQAFAQRDYHHHRREREARL